MHRAAIQDLEEALRLKPLRELHVEARKAKEMLRSSIRRVPPIRVPLQVVASVSNKPAAADNNMTPTEKTTDAVHLQHAAAAIDEQKKNKDYKETSKPVDLQSLTSRPAFKTSYELLYALNAMGTNHAAKAMYLQEQVPLSDLSRLLAKSFEPDLLTELLSAINALSDDDESQALAWLRALIALPRFEMAALLISKNSQSLVENMLGRMIGSGLVEENELGTLRKKFML